MDDPGRSFKPSSGRFVSVLWPVTSLGAIGGLFARSGLLPPFTTGVAVLGCLVLSIAVAFATAELWRVVVLPHGLKAPDYAGRHHLVEWSHIVTVRPLTFLGLKFLRVFSRHGGPVLWLPLFLTDRAGFRTELVQHAGAGTPIGNYFGAEARHRRLRMGGMRALAILGFVVGAVVAMLWVRTASAPGAAPARFTYVTTARQLGVVGYRDPIGVISPDGSKLAYTEGRHVRVMPIGGGAPQTLAAGDGQIRYLAWIDNNRLAGEDTGADNRWWAYDVSAETPTRRPLWLGTSLPMPVNDLRQLTWSADGASAAAIANGNDGPVLVRIPADGTRAEGTPLTGRPSAPAWSPSGEIACVLDQDGHARISLPCGATPIRLDPDMSVIGPLAFSQDGKQLYFASPNVSGEMVELWSLERSSNRARRLTSFARDAYAPSVAADGTTIFKVQTYRTFVADVPAAGGTTRQLTAFQAETPSWHPTQSRVAFTYGTWRRVVDDAKYPDIAQDIGTIDLAARLPAAAPSAVIAQSNSEDQAMSWSPNGRWIAFHTHREMSDDVWLRPADGSQPDKRITFLGRGAEVGWPRWSPDGKTVLLDGARKGDGRSVIYTIGVDQGNGTLTAELREVKAEGFDGDITHAEWLPAGNGVIAIAKEAPGRHAIITLPLAGGRASIVHRFATEHDFPGLGIAPDGKQVAFTAPAADGYFQIFRMPLAGGEPVQVTADPSNKSQPAWSPDGARIAFTVWSYEAGFWSMR